MSGVSLIVIAKEPLPGRSKTRLSPPCSPAQAAALAEAALADTLETIRRTPATRHVLALDGDPGAWLPRGFELIEQRSGGLGGRLAGAFEDVGTPALLVGMDTPQLTSEMLADAAAELAAPGVGAVLGAAEDGGFWAIGLNRADRAIFAGVPMSSADTHASQLARIRDLGLRCTELAPLRDVDTIADAHAVASPCQPGSRFRGAVAGLTRGREPGEATPTSRQRRFARPERGQVADQHQSR